MATFLSGLHEIFDRYDGFIMDLWGVIHDGEQLYPHTLSCLEALQESGKSFVFLSNGPRRAWVAEERLKKLGLPEHLMAPICTSGEVTHSLLQEKQNLPSFKKVLPIGTQKDISLYEGLSLNIVSSVREADFILCSDLPSPAKELSGLLKEAQVKGLTMICANPDRHVLSQGKLLSCAGSIAQQYEGLGGTVTWIGKPYPKVYDVACSLLPCLPSNKILAIGDSLFTDIQGGANYGLDTLLLTCGVHAPALRIQPGETPDLEALEKIYQGYQIKPTYVMNWLQP